MFQVPKMAFPLETWIHLVDSSCFKIIYKKNFLKLLKQPPAISAWRNIFSLLGNTFTV